MMPPPLAVTYHCVKSVLIRSFSGPYFPAFGLNTERYSVSLRIQSECGEIQTRRTLNTDTFHAVYIFVYVYLEFEKKFVWITNQLAVQLKLS